MLFLIGTNTTEAHPVVGYKMRQAARNGARMVVADPRRIELVNESDYFLQLKLGTDIAMLNGLMHIIIKEGLEDKEFVAEHCENYDALVETVKAYNPEKVSDLTGLPVEDLYKVARLYATTDKAMIFYTLGITEHICGVRNVMSIANLAMLTGHLGRPSTGVCPIRGQNNVQGACDMGALPSTYPGYQKVTDEKVREKFEQAWGVSLPTENGLMIPDMFHKANSGELKAMFILGENPVLTDADSNEIRSGLENLDFLVVQELFLTETAEYADVVLPAASFAECDGTNTNTERRVQRVRKAIEPLSGKANWEILADLLNAMGLKSDYRHPSEIYNEMASLTPSMAGINYERIDEKGLQWPCPTLEHPGTPFLHKDGNFTRGRGLFQAVEHVDPDELPDAEYPYFLSTGRILQHYNVTTMYSGGIMELWNKEQAQVHPEDAKKLGLESGGKMRITSRRGSVVSEIFVTDIVQPGMIWTSFHYPDTPINVVTNAAADPTSKTYEYKVCAVKLEKVKE